MSKDEDLKILKEALKKLDVMFRTPRSQLPFSDADELTTLKRAIFEIDKIISNPDVINAVYRRYNV